MDWERIFFDGTINLETIIACVIRMLLALALGFAIGFERKMRFKEAGVRTHTIVCVGSCLYMVISKFAFTGADTARVAAQIVSGIGFIGAGMIFYHKEMVHGLTTAAGIWATAAIGMAAGGGMIIVAIAATAIIILIQCIMHSRFKIFHSHHFVRIRIVFKDQTGEESGKIKKLFNVDRFNKINAKKEDGEILYSMVISTDKIMTASEIHKFITENPSIISITREDDDF